MAPNIVFQKYINVVVCLSIFLQEDSPIGMGDILSFAIYR